MDTKSGTPVKSQYYVLIAIVCNYSFAALGHRCNTLLSLPRGILDHCSIWLCSILILICYLFPSRTSNVHSACFSKPYAYFIAEDHLTPVERWMTYTLAEWTIKTCMTADMSWHIRSYHVQMTIKRFFRVMRGWRVRATRRNRLLSMSLRWIVRLQTSRSKKY
jgi:hypothetical protein